MASDVGPDARDGVSPRSGAGKSHDRVDGAAGRATAERTSLPSLSVVVPTYNEEDRIETCLDSIFEACGNEPSLEVIVVDSNSTDRTVELARQYPLTIYRIPDDDLTTPGAGRYVGQQAATGDHVLFVDGDMRLSGEWLEAARWTVHGHDDVAGVDGYLNTAKSTSVEPVQALRGVALYEASVLDQVDGFDPFLRALEDIELGYRVVEAGYAMRRLPVVAGSHPYTPGAAELLRRWRNGYFFGAGQAVRKSLDSPRTVAKFAARKRYQVLFLCWVGLGLATAVVQFPLVVAWLAVSLVLFAVDVAWEGSANATQRLGKYLLTTVGFVRGFLMPPRDHEEFPVEAAELLDEQDAVEA